MISHTALPSIVFDWGEIGQPAWILWFGRLASLGSRLCFLSLPRSAPLPYAASPADSICHHSSAFVAARVKIIAASILVRLHCNLVVCATLNQQGHSLNTGPAVLAPGPSMHVVARHLLSVLILEASAMPAESLYLPLSFVKSFRATGTPMKRSVSR